MKKVALITGASGNIGRAICSKFSRNGFRIIGTYLNSLDKKTEIEAFKKTYPDSEVFKVDFCNTDEVSNFISFLKNNDYRIDVFVNNAAIINTLDGVLRNEFLNFDLSSFCDVINCNFVAATRLSIELKDNINEGGNIVFVSSGGGLNGSYASISYNSSKAALNNLMESLSNNYYRFKKVRVNAVSPGWVSSKENTMGTEEDCQFMKKVADITPMGRNALPEEIANIVFFLSSNEASFINGSNVIVDGGYKNHNINYLEEAGYISWKSIAIDIEND